MTSAFSFLQVFRVLPANAFPTRYSFVHLWQFSWRPRPPSLLGTKEEQKLLNILIEISEKYVAEEHDTKKSLKEQEQEQRKILIEEWQAWLAKWRQLREEEKKFFSEQQIEEEEGDVTDEEETNEALEVDIEQVLDVKEEVVY